MGRELTDRNNFYTYLNNTGVKYTVDKNPSKKKLESIYKAIAVSKQNNQTS